MLVVDHVFGIGVHLRYNVLVQDACLQLLVGRQLVAGSSFRDQAVGNDQLVLVFLVQLLIVHVACPQLKAYGIFFVVVAHPGAEVFVVQFGDCRTVRLHIGLHLVPAVLIPKGALKGRGRVEAIIKLLHQALVLDGRALLLFPNGLRVGVIVLVVRIVEIEIVFPPKQVGFGDRFPVAVAQVYFAAVKLLAEGTDGTAEIHALPLCPHAFLLQIDGAPNGARAIDGRCPAVLQMDVVEKVGRNAGRVGMSQRE